MIKGLESYVWLEVTAGPEGLCLNFYECDGTIFYLLLFYYASAAALASTLFLIALRSFNSF